MSKVDFRNKTVWICGASSGIGEALAYKFSALGANLILSARRFEKLEMVKGKCHDPSKVAVIPMDITDPKNIKSAVEEVGKMPQLDMLLLDSGIAQKGLAWENPEELERKIMETNYFGTVALAKAVFPIFKKQNHGWYAVVTSIAGVAGVPGRSAYSASKHALHGFFDSLRAEAHDMNIFVSIIMPGFINTHITVKELQANGSPYGKIEKSHKLGMDPGKCARHIIHGLQNRKLNIVVGGFETSSVYLNRYSPRLYDFMVRNHPMKKWRRIISSISFHKKEQ